MTMKKLEVLHVFDLAVQVGPPVEAGNTIGASGRGRRRIIPILGGTVRGPAVDGIALEGRVLPGGADYQMVVSDTVAELDARYMLELVGGERIYVTNHALRRAAPDVTARLVRGDPVDPSQVYFRCVPSFEVSAPGLAWMTDRLFVGTGVRLPDRVELAVFQVL
ncbi:DUF3237 domain-containing protein [Ramlibacter sp. MMS24-I3-19]|uniref:DUF3237 domain-containing protein n=1 Tax=Ramlibacter sp. MMS24-I3-19 TaxID=3416606 RepID=UPI003CFE1564